MIGARAATTTVVAWPARGATQAVSTSGGLLPVTAIVPSAMVGGGAKCAATGGCARRHTCGAAPTRASCTARAIGVAHDASVGGRNVAQGSVACKPAVKGCADDDSGKRKCCVLRDAKDVYGKRANQHEHCRAHDVEEMIAASQRDRSACC